MSSWIHRIHIYEQSRGLIHHGQCLHVTIISLQTPLTLCSSPTEAENKCIIALVLNKTIKQQQSLNHIIQTPRLTYTIGWIYKPHYIYFLLDFSETRFGRWFDRQDRSKIKEEVAKIQWSGHRAKSLRVYRVKCFDREFAWPCCGGDYFCPAEWQQACECV